MKQRPILFSTPMVQAILEGRKTQTRRIVKGMALDWLSEFTPEFVADPKNGFCPYGIEGDIIWVRETWRKYHPVDGDGYTDFNKDIIDFAADNPEMIYKLDGDGSHVYNKNGTEKFIPWKPSIHMPKVACRLFLENTYICIERLQDITDDDAIAEGIQSYPDEILQEMRYKDYLSDASGYGDPQHDYPTVGDPISSYKSLWQKINGEESWDVNPWVWVIEFNKKEKSV